MSVVKFIELSGRSSESFADAVRQTVEHASQTIRNIQSVWVKEFEGVVENNRVIRIPGEGLGLDSCAVAKRVGWCAMSRGGRLWRGLLTI